MIGSGFAPVDNQAVRCRPLGDAMWLTDFVTPNNPDILLKAEKLQGDIRMRSYQAWKYVSAFPYKEIIASTANVEGKKLFREEDTWFMPSEVMRAEISNCANRAFLMASLLRTYLPPNSVYVGMGYVEAAALDGIGAHAWVIADVGEEIVYETTIPNEKVSVIPRAQAERIYDTRIIFNDDKVLAAVDPAEVARFINDSRFGFVGLQFLETYLCTNCHALNDPRR